MQYESGKYVRRYKENNNVKVEKTVDDNKKQEEKNVGKKPLAEVDEENPDVYDALSRK